MLCLAPSVSVILQEIDGTAPSKAYTKQIAFTFLPGLFLKGQPPILLALFLFHHPLAVLFIHLITNIFLKIHCVVWTSIRTRLILLTVCVPVMKLYS